MRDEIRVLHVDDDRDLTDMLSAWFEANVDGMSVIAENDPADALEVIEAANVDCVVSDYDMPGTDGLAFLEQIQSLYPDLPFILFTGKGSEEIASEAISAGVTDYLQKETGTEQYEVLANRIENAVERRRARQALEESEGKYSTLVEEASDGVLIVQDGIIEFVNQKTADILGATVDEIQGEPMPTFVAPEDRDLLADRYVRREAGEDVPDRYQFTAISPDGDRIPIELTSSRITYGGESAVMAICRDISERIEREAKLDQYRTLVETVGDAMYALDETGTITMVNEALTEQIGMSRDELVGEPFTAFLRDEDVETGREVIRDLLSSDERSRGRFEFELTVDGETRVYEDSLAVITDEDGNFEKSVGTIRDVTERKARKRELEMYRTTVNAADDAVYAVDTEGTILMANDRLVEVVGIPRDELVGSHIAILVQEGVLDASAVQEGYEVVSSLFEGDRRRVRFETRTALDDGPRIVENNFTRFRDGDSWGAVNIIRDVTERKERERTLRRQNERLEEVVSVLSHDLRNPLEVAQGRASLLRETVTDGSGETGGTVDAQEIEHLDRIERAHARMSTIIDDVLTLARQGATATDLEPTDVGAVAEEAWLHVDTASATLVTEDCRTVEANPGRLTQLFENLFRNAVEHGGEDVTVRVGGDESSFYVADDGPGIPPDERDHVFESGFTTAEDGTGFGLAIVREIAEAHDWTVSVTGSDAGGARFEFTDIRTA